jgi:hypothetical protein
MRYDMISFTMLLLFICSPLSAEEQSHERRNAISRLEAVGGHFFYEEAPNNLRIKSLAFEHPVITAADINAHTSLLEVIEKGTNKSVNDNVISNLKVLNEIKYLYLNGTAITDSALEYIKEYNNLVILDLSDMLYITGPGLKHLNNLKQLNTIKLSGLPRLDESNLIYLNDIPSLEIIDLYGNIKFTDVGLSKLSKLENLKKLDISTTSVTDEGLKQLTNLKKLEWINAIQTRITEKGRNEFMKILPNCRISLGNLGNSMSDSPASRGRKGQILNKTMNKDEK